MSNLKDAIDAYFRDVDDEQFLRAVRAAGFKPIPRHSWADALAFALMDLAALISRRVWSKEREAGRTRFAVLQPDMDIRPEVVIGQGLVRWWVYTVHLADGWRPARYV